MGQLISIQYVTDAFGNKTAVQIPIEDWQAIEKEIAGIFEEKKQKGKSTKGNLDKLLAEGYLSTKEEDREITEDFEAADFEDEN